MGAGSTYLGIFVVISIIWGAAKAFEQGNRATKRALSFAQRDPEYARTLHFLSINLREPLINCVVVPLWVLLSRMAALIPGLGPLQNSGLLMPLLMTLPMAVLLMPLEGLSYSQPYRSINRRILLLGLARWALTALTYQMTGWSFLSFFAGIALLWYSSAWGKKQLDGPLSVPQRLSAGAPAATVAAAARPPVMQAARTASTPAVVPVRPRPAAPPQPAGPAIPPGPPVLCPVCHMPTSRSATECHACGLVFLSRVPPALRSLPNYRVLRPLSSGGMSSIYLAYEPRHERLCVLKTLASVESHVDPHWRTEAARCLQQEAALLQQINHPNIAGMLDWFSTPTGDFLVLEYIPGLTLEQRLTRPDGRGGMLPGAPLPLREVLSCGITVASVLDYLARLPRPVVHHDIKPANLIVRPDSQRLMLVDFGGAVLLPDSSQQTARLECYGTPGYAAPEQYYGQSSPRSDVYGLATTLYHLLTDDDPTGHPLKFPSLSKLSPGLVQLLQPAMAPEPHIRPDAAAFRAALMKLAREI